MLLSKICPNDESARPYAQKHDTGKKNGERKKDPVNPFSPFPHPSPFLPHSSLSASESPTSALEAASGSACPVSPATISALDYYSRYPSLQNLLSSAGQPLLLAIETFLAHLKLKHCLAGTASPLQTLEGLVELHLHYSPSPTATQALPRHWNSNRAAQAHNWLRVS